MSLPLLITPPIVVATDSGTRGDAPSGASGCGLRSGAKPQLFICRNRLPQPGPRKCDPETSRSPAVLQPHTHPPAPMLKWVHNLSVASQLVRAFGP